MKNSSASSAEKKQFAEAIDEAMGMLYQQCMETLSMPQIVVTLAAEDKGGELVVRAAIIENPNFKDETDALALEAMVDYLKSRGYILMKPLGDEGDTDTSHTPKHMLL